MRDNIDLQNKFVASFDDNRCNGIAKRTNMRCKKTINCPYHQNANDKKANQQGKQEKK